MSRRSWRSLFEITFGTDRRDELIVERTSDSMRERVPSWGEAWLSSCSAQREKLGCADIPVFVSVWARVSLGSEENCSIFISSPSLSLGATSPQPSQELHSSLES